MDLLRSLPIGLYLEKPATWLHGLDPRIKLIWLTSFLISPILASPLYRLGLVGFLFLITVLATVPLRVWRQQMGWLSLICIITFIVTCFSPDGLNISYQPRLPQSDLNLPNASGYQYILFDGFLERGWLRITRRSLDIAIRVSTLIFTVIYSSNLYLLTTSPEEITAGLEKLFQPLRIFKVPVTEIIITLTLSLRFIPLVLEEIQNLIRSINTRAINWQKIGFNYGLKIIILLVERLLENLLLRAKEIAIAMEVRGFKDANSHRLNWHQLRFRYFDWFALLLLIPFWWLRWQWGGV